MTRKLMVCCWLSAANLLAAFAGCGGQSSSDGHDGKASGAGGIGGGSGTGNDGGAGEATGGTGTAGGGAAGGAIGDGGNAGEAIGGGGGEGGPTGGDCTQGARRCVNETPETCSSDGEWQPAGAPCPFVCTDGVCGGECVPDTVRCTDATAETCRTNGTWRGVECPNACEAGECVDRCTEGARQCSGTLISVICTNGEWVNGEACPYLCQEGECTGECTPASLRCAGTDNLVPETCGANARWQPGSPCPYLCSDGTCTGDCAPGAAKCSGPQPETCDDEGHWQDDGPACSGTTPVCTTSGCAPCAGGACGWIRQFGTDSNDSANDVAVDSSGNVLVVGIAKGTLADGDSLEQPFVRKYDPSGTELWTRSFRAGTGDVGFGVAVDASGNVFVGGGTYFGTFPGQTGEDFTDAFIRKYDASGTVQWTRQFGTDGSDYVRQAAADPNGNVFVAGPWSNATITTAEVLLRKYDTSGNLLWDRTFGTTDFDDGYDVAVAENGNVYVSGKSHTTFPGQTGPGGAFVRKLNSSGVEQWTRQFGTNRGDYARGVAVDGNESVYAAGTIGVQEAFVRKYNASGTEQWTRQFGASAPCQGDAIALDESGNAYLLGTTNGAVAGQTSAGDYDVFARKYDPSGAEQWTRQLGTDAMDQGQRIAVDASGTVYVVGATRGTFPGQTSAGFEDAFLMRIVP